MNDSRVRDWINQDYRSLDMKATVIDVLEMCSASESTELPVVENNHLMGIIDMQDCVKSLKSGAVLTSSITPFLKKALHVGNGNFPVENIKNIPFYVIDEVSSEFLGTVGKKEWLKYHEKLNERVGEIEEQLDWYSLCFDSAYEGMAVVDDKGVIIMFNEAYSRFVGVSKEEALGQPAENVIDRTRLPVVLKTGLPEMNQVHQLQGLNMVVHRKPLWKEGKVVGAVGILLHEGISDLYKIVEQMEHQLVSDPLTKRLVDRRDKPHKMVGLDDILGESPAIYKTKKLAGLAAQSKATVLLLGESGVGKEQFARAIHQMGITKTGPFITVNCAAIPESLLESELFGYTDGAFTGAKRSGKPGKFELAQKGTLFLDEIGDMPLVMQVKILRVLQEKEVERVGGTHPIPLDFRLIAATNQDLKAMVSRGEFREDLYHRLHVIPIPIPPLRQRKVDIPLIVSEYSNRFSSLYGMEGKTIDSEVLQRFFKYDWPGNVRELINLLERLFVLTDQALITVNDLPEELTSGYIRSKETSSTLLSLQDRHKTNTKLQIEEEKGLIEKILKEVKGNKSRAAERLGISRATLYNKLARLNL